MTTYRNYTIDDYEQLVPLWLKSNMRVAPELQHLPTNGVVVQTEDKVIGAVFMYFTSNSNRAIIAFPIVDPDLKEDRENIVSTLFDYAEYTIRLAGYDIIDTWTPLEHVEKRLIDRGYVTGDTEVTHFIKIL